MDSSKTKDLSQFYHNLPQEFDFSTMYPLVKSTQGLFGKKSRGPSQGLFPLDPNKGAIPRPC